MAVEKVEEFFAKVGQDEELQAKVHALMEKKHEQDAAIIAELVGIAAAAGIEFSVADYAEARHAAMGDLSADDLRQVAGGGDIEPVVYPKPPECEFVMSWGVTCMMMQHYMP